MTIITFNSFHIDISTYKHLILFKSKINSLYIYGNDQWKRNVCNFKHFSVLALFIAFFYFYENYISYVKQNLSKGEMHDWSHKWEIL